MVEIKQAAALGGGVIGGGWIARLLINGIDVKVYDPSPDAERMTGEMIANAERAYAKLTLAPTGVTGKLEFVDSIEAAVSDAQFIQESAPERVELKQSILAEVDKYAPADALICSSTSGLLPTELQSVMSHPERFMVGHPFNPVYLLPLVEICGGDQTTLDHIERAKAFYKSIGMKPLHLKKEIDGFVADRLLEALWRESLWLVHDDIATVEEVDDAIRYGAGLRWAFMGSFQTYRIAGGEAGMRHFMAQFGPALKWPWTKLMDVPELTDEFLDKIAAQSDEQAGDLSIREMERNRDDCLISLMQALKTQDYASGKVLADYEEQLYKRAHGDAVTADTDYSQPLRLLETSVQPDWVDYNNHMTESRYLQVFGDTTDALLSVIGVDKAYHEAGFSYYTVETHIMHLQEVAGLEPLYATTQVMDADEKRIHVFHRIHHGRTDEVLASAEQMLLHVDKNAERACPADKAVQDKLLTIFEAHKSLDRPPHAGRSVGIKHSS